ncbi:IclR family transcriptional regulator [Sphingomonas lenta]|uniref:Transcriptional regulator n=1 Tax=Sphingomonas lenta TaxID=1141887 RepID=A0A2A2SIL0_9SPHN|nr:helix-turn-helix domain-containing protein [Sphingomonas lenta]PAX09069.1 transcriptional regulator [Sphingomonas lenta]
MQSLPAQPNNSLMLGMECLRAITDARRPIGSREVARRMGLTHTRVNRLLGTLAYMGMLERDAERRYRPGPALHMLAAQSIMASRLLPAAMPVLKRLSRQGHTVALGTLWQGRICYLFHERPGQSVEDAILRHEIWPADQSSLGIALLAAGKEPLDPASVPSDPVRERKLPGQSLSELVEQARERGYAELRFTDDTISVGVAVGAPPVAGLGISSQHLGHEFVPRIAATLHEAAAEILDRMSSDDGEPQE